LVWNGEGAVEGERFRSFSHGGTNLMAVLNDVHIGRLVE
jgi:hypothetical protein